MRLGLLWLVLLAPVAALAADPGTRYSARGTVVEVSADRASVMIAHEAIPHFMGAMTMKFETRRVAQVAGLEPGTPVTFSFTATDDGRLLLDSISRRVDKK